MFRKFLVVRKNIKAWMWESITIVSKMIMLDTQKTEIMVNKIVFSQPYCYNIPFCSFTSLLLQVWHKICYVIKLFDLIKKHILDGIRYFINWNSTINDWKWIMLDIFIIIQKPVFASSFLCIPVLWKFHLLLNLSNIF